MNIQRQLAPVAPGQPLPVAHRAINIAFVPAGINIMDDMRDILRNIVRADLYANAQFGGDYGYKLGMSILRVIYVNLHNIRAHNRHHIQNLANNVVGLDHTEITDLLVGYVPAVATQTQLSFPDFLAKLVSTEKVMSNLFEERNSAHDRLVQILITANKLAAGDTRDDLVNVTDPLVSAVGQENDPDVQLCCVFKCLKMYSYLLQEDQSDEIADRVNNNIRAAKIVMDYADGTRDAVIQAKIDQLLIDTMLDNDFNNISVLYP